MSTRAGNARRAPARARRTPPHGARRRRFGALAAVGLLALALYLLAGSGSSRAPAHRPTLSAAHSPRAHSSVALNAGRHEAARRAHLLEEGRLPQTNALPAGSGARLASTIDALWEGIREGSAAAAMPAFFPLAAYLQVKAIENPAADWHDRLVRDFELDLAAAHRLLGRGAAGATLLEVRVPMQYAHWVQPGVCYNSVGYYEVPNSRLVYREGGEVRSIGIASMISWRGVWYVVHLGAVEQGEEGVIDEPAAGAGTSAYSSTC
jgi:hypothetical protein